MSRKDAICNINEVFGDRPHAKGSDTSWYAAHSIPAERLSRLKKQILDVLRSLHPDGLTDDELSGVLREYRYTVAPRRRWLVLAGLVEDTGGRRLGERGRKQVIWGFKINASYIEQRDSRIRAKGVRMTYPAALALINKLHREAEFEQWHGRCIECHMMWPCPTNDILELARRRPKETVK